MLLHQEEDRVVFSKGAKTIFSGNLLKFMSYKKSGELKICYSLCLPHLERMLSADLFFNLKQAAQERDEVFAVFDKPT